MLERFLDKGEVAHVTMETWGCIIVRARIAKKGSFSS